MIGEVKASREEAAVDRDPRVREREQRHDHVARPRVEELLQPLVRRDRRPEAHADRARQLRGRLLAELAEPLRGALELGPRSRVGVGQEAHREADDDRLDPGLEQRHPDRGPEHEVDEPDANARAPRDEDSAPNSAEGREERHDATCSV